MESRIKEIVIIRAIFNSDVDAETKYLDLEDLELKRVREELKKQIDNIEELLIAREDKPPISREDLDQAINVVNRETKDLFADAEIQEKERQARFEAIKELHSLLI